MAERIVSALARLDGEAVADVAGGLWIAALLVGLMHLPLLVG